jgi:small GTP-binding protein
MAHSSVASVRPTVAVRESLVELRALANELLPPDSLADLDDAIARLDDVRCNVAVLGEFKRGKSTLVNALVEHALLPTGVLPVTAAITVVRHGTRPRLVVGYIDGGEEERPFSALRGLVTESGDPASHGDVVSVAVEMPDGLLARGVQVVDTPGIGSIHAHNTTMTERFLGRVDVALCVLAADQPLNAPERELIGAAADAGARLMFTVNKIDQIEAGDRAATLQFVAEGLRDLVGPDPEILALSARTGEGVPALRQRLVALADAELGDVVARSGGTRGARMAASAAQAARLQAAALRLPMDELQERACQLELRLGELEQAHQDARDLLARGVERALAARVDEPLTRLARDRRADLESELALVGAGFDGGSRKLAGELDAWIDERTRGEFTVLATRYAHEISSELRMLESRYAARVTEILNDVRAAAQSGLNTDLTGTPVAAGLRRPPAFTFKLDDPEDTLDRLAAAGRALLPGALGRRLVLRAARERLLAMTDRHAGRLRSALVSRAREGAREYADELEAAVEAACGAIRVAVARARESHADQRQPAELRLRDLAACEARCRDLAAALQETAR